jgi:hypothetical protein
MDSANVPASTSEWIARGFDAIIVVASDQQVSSEFDSEAVVLELGKGVYYGLNAVAARVWTLVQEPVAATAIRDALLADYDVEPARCERELIALLDDMASRDLIRISPRAEV